VSIRIALQEKKLNGAGPINNLLFILISPCASSFRTFCLVCCCDLEVVLKLGIFRASVRPSGDQNYPRLESRRQARQRGTRQQERVWFQTALSYSSTSFTYREGVSKHWENIQNVERGFATVVVLGLVSPEGRVATRCGNRGKNRSPRQARDRFSCRVCLSLSQWLWWQLVHCNPFSFCRNLEGERTKTLVHPICSVQQLDLPAELHCTASQHILILSCQTLLELHGLAS
jgi:hypothetical protein